MINEISMHVVPKNKNGVLLFLVTLSVGAVLSVIAGNLESYRGIVGLFGLFFFVASLYSYTRYVVREYYYDVTVIEDEPLLVVRQLIGKRSTVMCRIALADIVKVELFANRGELGDVANKLPPEYTKFNYTVTLSLGQPSIRLTVNSRDGKCGIVLEGGSELAELMRNYSEQARVHRMSEYE